MVLEAVELVEFTKMEEHETIVISGTEIKYMRAEIFPAC